MAPLINMGKTTATDTSTPPAEVHMVVKVFKPKHTASAQIHTHVHHFVNAIESGHLQRRGLNEADVPHHDDTKQCQRKRT